MAEAPEADAPPAPAELLTAAEAPAELSTIKESRLKLPEMLEGGGLDKAPTGGPEGRDEAELTDCK